MIITEEKREVGMNGVQVGKEMTIKATPMAFKMLAQNMYKDPIGAILREYGQNCLDSHKRAGNTDPFTIEFPSIANPVIKFIDYGTGMDPAFIEDDEAGYLSIFHSTKRGENESSGGFGVGRVSLLAITDSYTIENRYNGRITVYNLFQNARGIPQLARISDGETKEKNGVTITSSVPLNKINDFHSRAAAIYKFYDIIPNFVDYTGGPVIPFTSESPYQGKNWSLDHDYKYGGRSYIWMGCYSYEIDNTILSNRLTREQNLLLKCGITFKVNVGDVSVNASREAVNYDEKTYQFIQDKLSEIFIDVYPILERELLNGKTIYHNRNIYKKYSPPFKSLIRDCYSKSLKIDNISSRSNALESINPHIQEVVKDGDFPTYLLAYAMSKEAFTNSENRQGIYKISFNGNYDIPFSTLIVINDVGLKNTDQYKNLCNQFYSDSERRYIDKFILVGESFKEYLIKENILDLFTIIKASSFYVKPAKTTVKVKRPVVYRFFTNGKSMETGLNVVDKSVSSGKTYYIRYSQFENYGIQASNVKEFYDLLITAGVLKREDILVYTTRHLEKKIIKELDVINLLPYWKKYVKSEAWSLVLFMYRGCYINSILNGLYKRYSSYNETDLFKDLHPRVKKIFEEMRCGFSSRDSFPFLSALTNYKNNLTNNNKFHKKWEKLLQWINKRKPLLSLVGQNTITTDQARAIVQYLK